MLERAISTKNSKPISLHDLRIFCSKYLASGTSSDEDDDPRNGIREIRKPYIKIEDSNCQHMPSVREFDPWPQILPVENIQLGRSIFSDLPSQPGTPVPTSRNTAQQLPQTRGVKRRHAIQCEICDRKVGPNETIEEHIKTEKHQEKTGTLNWSAVKGVIESLPGFGTLNMMRLTNGQKESSGDNFQEFLCLHKVESVSQLFELNRHP